jgi:creatinine amidohydrolase
VVRDGYDTADHIANDRKDLLTVGMEAYIKTGVIGRPSLATAEKADSSLTTSAKRSVPASGVSM